MCRGCIFLTGDNKILSHWRWMVQLSIYSGSPPLPCMCLFIGMFIICLLLGILLDGRPFLYYAGLFLLDV